VYCANSELLILSIHVEKRPSIFLQIQRWSFFLPKARAQTIQKRLPHSTMEHQTTKMKLLGIRPTMAMLILSQHNNQPAIPRH
jgi:hypothetical protein